MLDNAKDEAPAEPIRASTSKTAKTDKVQRQKPRPKTKTNTTRAKQPKAKAKAKVKVKAPADKPKAGSADTCDIKLEDAVEPQKTDAEIIDELAQMSELDYSRIRQEMRRKMGLTSVAVLDKARTVREKERAAEKRKEQAKNRKRESFTDDFDQSNTSDTIDINKDLGSNQSTSDGTPNDGQLLDEEPEDEDKDSIIAKKLARKIHTELAFDEIAVKWYSSFDNFWQEISDTQALKVVDNILSQAFPEGFSITKLRSIEGLLRIYLSDPRWETSTDLLPLANGVLNLKTKELLPYTAQYKFQWQLPYGYDPGQKIDIVWQWLVDVTGNDLAAIKTIRAFMRLLLVGGTVQKFLEIIGPGGTGKSTLIRLLIALVGDINHAATDLKNLEDNRFEAAMLYGKRLAVISDSSRYGGECSVLKAITGQDPVRLERKNKQQSNSFVFGGAVIIASNAPIQSTDYSSGLARRRLPIRFSKKISDADKKKA